MQAAQDRPMIEGSWLPPACDRVVARWIYCLQDWSFGHTNQSVDDDDDDMFLEFLIFFSLHIYLFLSYRLLMMMMMKTKKRKIKGVMHACFSAY